MNTTELPLDGTTSPPPAKTPPAEQAKPMITATPAVKTGESTKDAASSKKASKSATPATTSIPLVNPGWIDETVRKYGLSGQLGKAVGVELARRIEAQVAKATTKQKLAKLVKSAVGNCIGNVSMAE